MFNKIKEQLGGHVLKFIIIFIWITIFGTLFLILNDIFAWYSLTIGRIVPAGLGAIGTLLLAWVTARTLKQNKDLVQSEKAQIKPSLRRIGKYSVDEENKNRIKLGLENVGYGKAVNIRIVPQIYARHVSSTFSPHVKLESYTSDYSIEDLPNINVKETSLYKYEKDIDILTGSGGILESGESAVFSTRIDYKNTDNDEWEIDTEYPNVLVFDRLIDILSDEEDIPELGFRFILIYEDVLGNSYEQSIPGPLFRVSETDTLSDTLSNPTWVLGLDERAHKQNQINYIKGKIKGMFSFSKQEE